MSLAPVPAWRRRFETNPRRPTNASVITSINPPIALRAHILPANSAFPPRAGDVEKGTDTKSCLTILGCKGHRRYLALREGSMALVIIGVLVGIAIGLRFNVVVLISAIALAVMFALIFGVARGESFWSIVLAVVIVGMAIKLGYFVGIFLAKRIQ